MSFSFVLLLSSNTDLVSRELIKRPLHLRTARSAHSIVHSFFWSFFLHCFSAFSILTQELFQAFATSIEREFVFCYRISSSSAKRMLFTETIFPDLLYCFSNDSSFWYLPFYVCFNLSHGYRKKKLTSSEIPSSSKISILDWISKYFKFWILLSFKKYK